MNFRANGAGVIALQENHYYPFGLEIEGPKIPQVGVENQYQYNGKELNEDFGLNWSDYGARWYDAALGRFPGIDPLADTFNFVTPYNYAENEPVAHIDLWGMQQVEPNMTSNYLNNAAQGMKTIAFEFGLTLLEGAKKAGEFVTMVGDYAASYFPSEGTPAANAYMQNENYSHNGTGHEMQTNSELKSNGTAFLPSAKGGTDKIFTDADFIFPKDAGGAWDDAASSMPVPHALNYAAKALSQTQDAQNAVEQVPLKKTLGKDTFFTNGQGFSRERILNPAPGDPTQFITPINGN